MILSDCYRSCPFRSNVSSNPYHCDCVACPQRTSASGTIVSNHTLTQEELRLLSKNGGARNAAGGVTDGTETD